jgi:signal transduction histidine kinase
MGEQGLRLTPSASRERVIEAGEKERQWLERILHDGAQQRLIALSLDLRRLEERLATTRSRKRGSTRRDERSRCRWTSCAMSHTASIRRW